MKNVDHKTIFLLVLVIGMGIVVGTVWSMNIPQSARVATPTPVVQTELAADPSPETVNSPSTGKLQANYELVATQSGQTALQLLQSSAEVETKNYGSAGDFVTKINGLEGNNEYYWAFYLNDEYAEKGASQTTLNEGDKIKFVYEAVSLTN